ncbi:hypothetical protein CY35_10G068200 [Sphagnum magellanicum]|nr:hypothetical protein CY35_10G068200 [Sphagnum magellanicum]
MLAFPSPSALVSHKLLLHSSPSLSSLSSPSSCSSSALLSVVEALPSSCCSTFQASFRRCGNSKSRAASSSSSSKVPFPSYRSVEAASSACCHSKNYEAASLSSSSCSKLGTRLSLNSRPPHPLQSCRQGVSYGSLRKMRSPCSSLCLQAPNQARYAEKFLCGIWWWQLGKNRRGRVQASVPLPQPLRFIRRAFLSRLLTYSSNFSDIDPVQLSELWVKTLKVSRDPRKILKAFHHSFVFVVVLAQVENDISGSTSSTKIIGVGRAVSDGAFIATICDVAVDPEYQKRGIGRRIVKQLVQDMKRKGGPTGYAVFPPKASWRFFWMIGFRSDRKYRFMAYRDKEELTSSSSTGKENICRNTGDSDCSI